jgi:hypothetical protein
VLLVRCQCYRYGELTATLANIFPTFLDQDLSNVGILLEGSTDFYPQPQEEEPRQFFVPENGAGLQFSATGGDSGDITPVSVSASSEFDFTSAAEGAPCCTGETEPSANVGEDSTVVDTKDSEQNDALQEENGSSGMSALLTRSVESLGRKEASKLVGEWVLESSATLAADMLVTVETAEEEERTITSSMTATSPARTTIFQVMGCSYSCHNLPQCDQQSSEAANVTADLAAELSSLSDFAFHWSMFIHRLLYSVSLHVSA